MITFPLRFEPDDNGTLLVTCPLLPEVTTFGEDREEALVRGAEAVEEAVGARMARWEDVPRPRAVSGLMARLPLLSEMKLSLYLVCRATGVTRAELVRRLGWRREQVDRLFRLDHRSRPDQIEAALSALGRTMSVAVD